MLPEAYTGDSKQIGPRVHPDLWEDFKAYAQAKHGKAGETSREVEKAIYEHMTGDDRGDKDGAGTSERLDVINAKLDSLLMAANQ